MPFDAGAPAAQDRNFVLLDFEDGSGLSALVFVEGLTSNQYLERKADIARYRRALDCLRNCALSSCDSVEYLVEMRKAYASEQAAERYPMRLAAGKAGGNGGQRALDPQP